MPSTDSIAKGAGIKIGFEMPSNKISNSQLPEQFDLILLINFLEEEVEIPQVMGAVKFRLKEVAIGLKIENGSFSIEDKFPSRFAEAYSSQQNAPAAIFDIEIAGIRMSKKIEFYRRPIRDVDYGRKSTSWILRAPNSLLTLSHVTPLIHEKAGMVTVVSDKETCVVQLIASVEGSKNFYFTHGLALGQKKFRDSIAACIEILLCKQFFKRDKSTLCTMRMEVSCEGEITYFPSSSWSEELLSQPPFLEYMYNSAMELSKAGATFLEIANSFGLDRTTDFTHADLSNLDFSNADLRQLDVTGSILTNANFHGANLSGMRFTNVDLSNADFSNADLKGSLFVGCYMPGVIMTDSLLDRHSRFLNIVGMDYQLATSLESAGGIVKFGALPTKIDQIISIAKDANRLLNTEEIGRIRQMSIERGYASSEQAEERAQAVNWLQDCCNGEIYHGPFQYSLVAGSTLPIDDWLSSTGHVLPMSSQAALQFNVIDAPPRVQACFDYAANSASFE